MRKGTEVTLAVILIIFVVAVIILVVNNSPSKLINKPEEEKTTKRFEMIDSHYIGDDINFLHQYIFYDPETKVMYTCIGDGGPLTVMLDGEGNPRLYTPKNMK